ncbi:MAG: 4Fe-4S dicluster domain-containing protein [Candidatus Eisenbacteria bacterium]
MSGHQYAMVMDLNKCIGCQTCTLACKKQWTDGDGMDYMYWNNVETHPGVGYPRGWHSLGGGFDQRRHLRPSALPGKKDYGEAFEYDYGQRLFEGKGKPVMPHEDPTFSPNWDEDVGGWDPSNPYFFYLPRICNHCTHPACLEACPRKAIYKREEDGIVLIDQERCRGYRYCIKACPYKKIYFNEVLGKSEKCIFCYPRLEKGRANACAAQCPGRIRFVGLLDDPESPVHALVRRYEVALPLLPEKGTSPNVYYVPPFSPPKEGAAAGGILEDARLPLDYLRYLFGPKVDGVLLRLEAELKKARNGGRSEILQLLIGRDERVRYRILPKALKEATPAEVRGVLDDKPSGPGLEILGTQSAPGSEERPAGEEEARRAGRSDSYEKIAGLGAAAAGFTLRCPPPGEGEGCGGCDRASGCGPKDGAEEREEDESWS